MAKTRILLADDHQILAEGVRTQLEPEFSVVGVVTDGHGLLTVAEALRPDVIVADITMPGLNGIEAAIRLREAGISAKVVFLTMHRDVAYARRAMETGAAGYVLKHSVSSELVEAIREAICGRNYVSPAMVSELLQSFRDNETATAEAPERLTARQREVLQLIAKGHSAKEIAAMLKVSVRTAEAHRANIMSTLALNNTAELVRFAIRNGIVALD